MSHTGCGGEEAARAKETLDKRVENGEMAPAYVGEKVHAVFCS